MRGCWSFGALSNLVCGAAVLWAYTTTLASAASPSVPESVITLVHSNFSDYIEKHDSVLVEFYAPWCGHCQKLAPHYEAAAKELKDKQSPIVFAKVDASQENELSRKYEIAGYPSLKFFRSGKPEEYTGGRTKEAILKWLDDMTGPSVTLVDSLEAAKKVIEPAAVAFVGAFTSKDSSAMKLFESYADAHRSLGKFVAYVDPKVKESEQTVTVYRHEEGKAGKITVTTEEALNAFCTVEKLPLFGPINGDNYADYFAGDNHLVWFAGTDEHYKAAASLLRQVAKNYRSTHNFVWLSSTEFKDHAVTALGVSEFPALVLQRKDGRFVYSDHTFTDAKKIEKFLQDVDNGKIEKYLMSEEIPESNNEPIKVVVGKTFEQIVLQKDKHVLLEVYAPWCGHCKNFEPTYQEFAKKMADRKDLIVAKMDGTKNESPNENFTWSG